MRYFRYLLLLLTALTISINTYSNGSLPKHFGKCGNLQENNMGNRLDSCKVGDVIIVQKKAVPMLCDYRYSIHRYGGQGITETFSCVLRVLKKDRHN